MPRIQFSILQSQIPGCFFKEKYCDLLMECGNYLGIDHTLGSLLNHSPDFCDWRKCWSVFNRLDCNQEFCAFIIEILFWTSHLLLGKWSIMEVVCFIYTNSIGYPHLIILYVNFWVLFCDFYQEESWPHGPLLF